MQSVMSLNNVVMHSQLLWRVDLFLILVNLFFMRNICILSASIVGCSGGWSCYIRIILKQVVERPLKQIRVLPQRYSLLTFFIPSFSLSCKVCGFSFSLHLLFMTSVRVHILHVTWLIRLWSSKDLMRCKACWEMHLSKNVCFQVFIFYFFLLFFCLY